MAKFLFRNSLFVLMVMRFFNSESLLYSDPKSPRDSKIMAKISGSEIHFWGALDGKAILKVVLPVEYFEGGTKDNLALSP